MSRTLAKREDYGLLFSSWICNASRKRMILIMELPMILWPTWILQYLLLPVLFFITNTFSLSQL